jgi:hypothetical protein
MRKLPTWLSVILLVLGLGLATPGPAAAAPYCGISWGSLAESTPGTTTAPITNVRTGRHACFDRMVIDVRGEIAGYSVRYGTVRAQGSGHAIPLRGGADLAVVVKAPAYSSTGRATYRPANPKELVNVAGYSTFRQLSWGGSYEGYTTIGLGVRARLPFRAFTLDGPGTMSRLVIDVAHRW